MADWSMTRRVGLQLERVQQSCWWTISTLSYRTFLLAALPSCCLNSNTDSVLYRQVCVCVLSAAKPEAHSTSYKMWNETLYLFNL